MVLMCDFNARVERNLDFWGGALGRLGTGKMNSNGLRLLSLCAEHELNITNTVFQQKDKYKNTLKHQRSCLWHMLDYIITRQCHTNDVTSTRAMRGPECWTDHRLVRAQFKFQIRPLIHKQTPKKKLNCAALKNPGIRDFFRANLAYCLSSPTTQAEDPDDEWHKLCSIVLKAAEATIGFKKSSHADWFDENNEAIHQLLN